MTGLFKKPKMPPPPKPVRMPVPEDQKIKEAGRLTRAQLAARKGKRSTILTSSLGGSVGPGSSVGSSGKTLGA